MLHYLFGFTGRINRAKVWLFLLVAIAAWIVALIIAAVGLDWSEFAKSVKAQVEANPDGPLDFCAVTWPHIAGVKAIIAVALICLIWLAYIWAALAIYAKRLHDRNKSAWWLLLYSGLPFVLQMYAHSTAPAGQRLIATAQDMTLPGAIAYGIAVLISLWVFIELWCLRGTKGSNRFGVDPLEKGPVFCEPGKPVHGCVPKA